MPGAARKSQFAFSGIYEMASNVHMGNLRRKLGDDVENPRFIVSLLRRGFVFKNQREA